MRTTRDMEQAAGYGYSFSITAQLARILDLKNKTKKPNKLTTKKPLVSIKHKIAELRKGLKGFQLKFLYVPALKMVKVK